MTETKPTQQSFFYGNDPAWLRAQKKAYTTTGLKWPPMKRKPRRGWPE